jgi:LacI family transcriptional regulator
VHPALTTMRVDIAELGAYAMRVLLQTRTGGDVASTDVEDDARPIVPQLVVRESSVRAGTGTRHLT